MLQRARLVRWGTAVAVVASVPLVFAQPAASERATVTRGDFHAFAAGAGDARFEGLAGHAELVRTASGSTIVKVRVSGLAPDAYYPVHVHAAPCAAPTLGGPHYMWDDGAELWPEFTTNEAGVGNGKAVADRTAGAQAVSVVVHRLPEGGERSAPKIACADLAS